MSAPMDIMEIITILLILVAVVIAPDVGYRPSQPIIIIIYIIASDRNYPSVTLTRRKTYTETYI